MVCAICGESGARIRHMTRSYGTGITLVVIENVPVVSCPHCGESYLTGETLHTLEEIKQHRERYTAARPVDVAPFQIGI